MSKKLSKNHGGTGLIFRGTSRARLDFRSHQDKVVVLLECDPWSNTPKSQPIYFDQWRKKASPCMATREDDRPLSSRSDIKLIGLIAIYFSVSVTTTSLVTQSARAVAL